MNLKFLVQLEIPEEAILIKEQSAVFLRRQLADNLQRELQRVVHRFIINDPIGIFPYEAKITVTREH